MVDTNQIISLTKEEYEALTKSSLELDRIKKIRNENTYKYMKNPDNKEKLKERRREYARKN